MTRNTADHYLMLIIEFPFILFVNSLIDRLSLAACRKTYNS